MISFLRGRLVARGADWVEVDVGGIGFRASVSRHAARALPPTGAEAVLPTLLAVGDDGVRLFGFADEGEREAFRALTSVGGVGARTALAILSSLTPAALAQAIRDGDAAALTAVPGVGRKTAQRLLLELRERFDGGAAGGGADTAAADAHAALVGLGYSGEEASRALAAAGAAAGDGDRDAAALVRAALRVLAGGR